MECDKRKTEEKMIDDIKKELLGLLIDIVNKNETSIDTKLTYVDNKVRNAKDLKSIIEKFKELLNSGLA